MHLLHPRINYRFFASGRALVERVLATGRRWAWRDGFARVARFGEVVLKSRRSMDVLGPGREDGRLVAGGAPTRRIGCLVTGGPRWVQRLGLERVLLSPLAAEIFRRMTGKVIVLRIFFARWEFGIHIVGVDQEGTHGH